MLPSIHTAEFAQRLQRIEALLEEAKQFPDPRARAHVRDLVQALLDLHGDALKRMVALVAEKAGPELIEEIAKDELTGGALLLYGLHPVALETRIRQALEQARLFLHSHGGNVQLLRVSDGVVRLHLEGSYCPSSAMTLRHTIEELIIARAPDVAAIEFEGLAATNGQAEPDSRLRVSLPMVHA